MFKNVEVHNAPSWFLHLPPAEVDSVPQDQDQTHADLTSQFLEDLCFGPSYLGSGWKENNKSKCKC